MTGGRLFWLIWCLLWAAFWITAGWFVLPVINTFVFVLCLAAAVPSFIGNERRETCPVCGQPYPAQNMALHVQVRHPAPTR
jgi:hypothetical protein